ncbi:MAG: short-chain dehydrogenase/reductase family protein [Monoraphidium minutum]|nr:MAG: short-chain dehydrogenase/reductase family protein [Monoraphidium minutum]
MFSTKGGVSASPMTGLPWHLLGSRGASGFGASSTAEEVAAGWDGSGKTVLITGAGTGLGLESARVLAARGAEVVIAVRDAAKGNAAAASIKAQVPGARVGVLALDLASLESVKDCATAFAASGRPLHVLMLNAGVMACPFALTKDGHEMQFGTNHLGHHALVHHLQPALEATAAASGEPGRVIVLSSSAHFGPYMPEGVRQEDTIDSPEGYSQWGSYGQSKLCNALFARELHRRWSAAGLPLVAVACHPGVIPASELFRHITLPWPVHQAASLALRPFFKSLAQGAATQTYLATAAAVPSLSGEYFADCNLSPSSPLSHDMGLAARLWAMSDKMCGFA